MIECSRCHGPMHTGGCAARRWKPRPYKATPGICGLCRCPSHFGDCGPLPTADPGALMRFSKPMEIPYRAPWEPPHPALAAVLTRKVPMKPVVDSLMQAFREHAARSYAWAVMVWSWPTDQALLFKNAERVVAVEYLDTAVTIGWVGTFGFCRNLYYGRGHIDPSTSMFRPELRGLGVEDLAIGATPALLAVGFGSERGPMCSVNYVWPWKNDSKGRYPNG